MTVEWRPVVGFEGSYEVSSLGGLRSLDRLSTDGRCLHGRFMRHASSGKYGYPQTMLRKDGKSHLRRIHRLVLEAFVGPCPDGMWARHLNGDRNDSRLKNLAWGTPSENGADRAEHSKLRADDTWGWMDKCSRTTETP
jgi:hypothetical protein